MNSSLRLFGLFLALSSAFLSSTAFAQVDRRANFDRWDADKDGRLVRDELPDGVRGNFNRLDADGDGGISREEHDAFVSRLPNGPANREAAANLPATVVATRDIPYAGTDHARQRLDLYLPKEPLSDKLPLIVFIHGGAWQAGDKSGGGRQVADYVATGEYAGASIGYRLSSDAVWPAQIHDCKAAIRWLRGNAEKHGLDPSRIAVMGSSAGGHLVAMLGTSGGIAALEGDLGDFDSADSRVTCVIDFFGPANLLTMGDFPSSIEHNAASSPESRLIGGAIQEHQDRAREASPQTHVTAEDAPFLILHGTEDPLVPYDQSVQLDLALRTAGVESHLVRVEGGGHGFGGPEINARVKAFLERHLWNKTTDISTDPIKVEPRPRPNAAPTR
jgi:acetyl esterase/lipase